MPVAPTYPGVYIQEISSGSHTITGVSTAVTAFVGRALRGPTNQAVPVTSFAEFERIFGGLWSLGTLSYAVQQFFQNGGSQAVIVRVYKASASTPAKAVLEVNVQSLDAASFAQVQSAANSVLTQLAATISGASPSATPSTLITGTLVDNYVATASTSNPSGAPAARSIGDAIVKAAAVANSKLTDVQSAAQKAVSQLVTTLSLEAAYEGAWGNNLLAKIDSNTADPTKLFNLTVQDGAGNFETIRKVSCDPASPRRIDKVLEQESKLVRLHGSSLPSLSLPGSKTDSPFCSVQTSGQAGDGDRPTATEYAPSDGKSGIYALNQTDIFNLLCIPPYDMATDIDVSVWTAAAAFCAQRRALLLVDPKSAWQDIASVTSAFSSGSGDPFSLAQYRSNAALFFPQIRAYDSSGLLQSYPPCGAVAGVMSRTDAQRGVWKAPAGMDAALAGVQQLSLAMTDLENGTLNQLGVNCLRPRPGAGRVVWGARTLEGADQLASDWKYIPVRRLALYIEESLFRGTQWVVFEPNDDPLWAKIRLTVGTFMQDLYRQSAFKGGSPREAFFVKCDKDTTTQSDINRGIVNITVGFAPLKPAEFVIISLQQMAGQVTA